MKTLSESGKVHYNLAIIFQRASHYARGLRGEGNPANLIGGNQEFGLLAFTTLKLKTTLIVDDDKICNLQA